MKKSICLLTFLLVVACAHSDKSGSAPSNSVASTDPTARKEGYGDFLFIPPGSPTIRNFVDEDGDGLDDRYQLQPGGKPYKAGHFYKK